MRVGVPRETAAGERRVALVPDAVGRLTGFEVAVERGAGEEAGFADDAYAEAGAELVDDAWHGVDAVVKVAKPSAEEAGRLGSGQLLVAFLSPLADREGVERLATAGVHGFAMESIPRTTRAQAMDALSSQATVSGYKAVLLAAESLPRFFPMLTTAAGTIAPARALVLGAGVAGLQAIGTGRRLGAVVSGFDVRPAVREQVQSLGARTFTTASASSADGSIEAPASTYAASGKDAAAPAPASTITSNPPAARRDTVSGTRATLRSPATSSFGTPTLMQGEL